MYKSQSAAILYTKMLVTIMYNITLSINEINNLYTAEQRKLGQQNRNHDAKLHTVNNTNNLNDKDTSKHS